MALTDNLVSYWKFDESASPAEDSVASNDLTLSGSASFTPGKINNGLSLGTGGDYASAAHNANMNFGTGDFSLAGWFKHTDTTIDSTENVVRHFNGGGWVIQFKGATNQVFWFARNSSNLATSNNNVIGQDTDWHHLAVTASGGTGLIYIDGVDVTNDSSIQSTASDVTTSLYFGSNGTAEDFDGLLDEWGMWSRALSSTEIEELYNGGAGLAYPFGAVGGATPPIPTLSMLGVG